MQEDKQLSDKEQLMQRRKTGFSRLIEIAGSKKILLFLSMLLSIGATIAQFVPYVSVYKILGMMADHADDIAGIDKEFIYYWAYVSLWAFVAFGLLLIGSLTLSHVAAFNILYELRVLLAQKLVRLPLGFFTDRASGEIKKIMNEDIERIELFVAHHIPDIIAAVVVPLLLIAYMFFIDWRLALVVLLAFAVAVFFMASMMMGRKSQQLYVEYGIALARMNSSIIEYIRGIQIVKTFTKSTKAYKQLNNDINAFHDFSVATSKMFITKYVWFYLILASVLLFVAPVATGLLLHAASYQVYVPKMLLFLIFSLGIFFPVVKLMWIIGFMNQNKAGVAALDDVLYKPEIPDCPKPVLPKDDSLEFAKVNFSYDGVTDVLQNLSFTAKPGTITALVGPSGAGKTTVALLAARFWDVAAGEIFIGGVSIKKISIQNLMDRVAFVFQDNVLFFDTIEENIRMGNSNASIDEVIAAAKTAQCHDFIEQLPQGYQTLVGESGTYLSGGEAQRIALARVALKDAPILLLDEATAFSDPENESKILAAFSYLTKGKTVLVIAHRLGTITNADQILYIDQGEIVERGKHEELLALQGRYAVMWNDYVKSRNWVLQK